MLGLFATLVFATAGCASATVIGTSLRDALPALRRLAAERRALAEDRVYLFTLIETPRHSGEPLPAQTAPAMPRVVVTSAVRRRAQVQAAACSAPLRAAA